MSLLHPYLNLLSVSSLSYRLAGYVLSIFQNWKTLKNDRDETSQTKVI